MAVTIGRRVMNWRRCSGRDVIFSSAPPAEADARSVESVQMQQNIKNLPEQKMHDMTFVFSEGD